MLLEAWANVNELGDGEGMGWSPLHECMLHPHSTGFMVTQLLHWGANRRLLGGNGLTPLQMAKMVRNYNGVRMMRSYNDEERGAGEGG